MKTLLLILLGIILLGIGFFKFKFLEDLRTSKIKNKSFYLWFPLGFLIFYMYHRKKKSA